MQQREQNRISRQAAARDIAALNARFQQEAEATELEIEMNARAAMEARGTATVAAGESGGFGGSFNALLDKFKREETEFRTSQLRTQAARRRQLALEQAGVRTNLHGRLLAALPSPVQRPDYLGASLRVLGDVAGLAGAQVRHDAILRRSGG